MWTMVGSLAATGLLLAGIFVVATVDEGSDATPPNAEGPMDDANAYLPSSVAESFTDPAGDATDTGVGDGASTVGCIVGKLLGDDCVDAPQDAPAAGTPAPSLDIVGVDYLGETVDDIVFRLTILDLAQDFADLRDPDGLYRSLTYELCWATAADAACDRSVTLYVNLGSEHVHLEPRFEIRNSDCNEWSWCAWGVEADVEFGAPGTITFRVPKAYLTADGREATVHHLQAGTGWIRQSNQLPMWHPGITVHTPLYHFHTHGGAIILGVGLSDSTPALSLERTLAVTHSWPSPEEGQPLIWAGHGANHGEGGQYDRPELDILWFDLFEKGDELVARFVVDSYEADPGFDFDYSVAIGIGDVVYEVGYRHEGSWRGEGHLYGYAGRCIMEPCQDGIVMEPEVRIQYGSPGIIDVPVPLAFIGNPEPGTATNLFWAMTMYSDVNYYWGEHGDEFFGDYHSVFEVDSLKGGYPYVFGSGHAAEV